MASSYTPLGIELMTTGENAGTWGTKTNSASYSDVDITGNTNYTDVTHVA